MATVGQALTSPESGWSRWKYNTKFLYSGSGWSDAGTIMAIKSSMMTTEHFIEFKFTGGKIRLIGTSSNDGIANGKISIDGVIYNFSQYRASGLNDVLQFEKTDLESNLHVVKIYTDDRNSNFLRFAGVDINENESLYLPSENPPVNKVLILNNSQYKKYDTTSSSWQTVTSISPTESDYLDGNTLKELSTVPQSTWQELTGIVEICYYTDDTSIEEAQFSVETNPFTLADELGATFDVVEYTDNPTQEDSVVTAETDLYSVYDYISETPEVLVYTELTDDVVIETTTEPFDIYEELGDSVDVLYYTDDTAVTEADLILEANYSPIDELDGDFEIVTWTDEEDTTAQRVLEMTAVPTPKFIKLVNPKNLYGYLEDVVANDISETYKFKEEVRYLFATNNTTQWYKFDFATETFVLVDASTNELIQQNGMRFNEVNSITKEQWEKWTGDYLNIGIFLKDNIRDTIVSVVDNLTYKDFLPRNNTTVSNTSLYILNTTAKIDLTMTGNTVKGTLSDDDLTRVQYRVLLNGNNYYPEDGSFTSLSASPQNIAISIPSSEVNIDALNSVKVEFKDYFGTTDYWQANFIGTYSGLLFKDINGNYYSSEVGEVLKFLDFGVIIAGQTTLEHEIILKNTYGYDVKNVNITANTTKFPNGMSLQFSDSLNPFDPKDSLTIPSGLLDGEEMSFYVRLKTELGATPDSKGSFDIIVRADRVEP